MIRILYCILIFSYSILSYCQSSSIILTFRDKTIREYNTEDIDSITFHEGGIMPTPDTRVNGVGNELKILAIGNSFTEDMTTYLGGLLESEGIPQDRIGIYAYILGGSSLETWDSVLKKNSTAPIRKIYGIEERFTDYEDYAMSDVLDNDWDIIVLQQLSSLYYDTSSYEPYLSSLIAGARKAVTGNVRIAWQMPWSRNSMSGSGTIFGEEGWRNNVAATKETLANYDIDFLIPTGTAIQNARHTTICPLNEFTRDDQHLGYGAGRYIAAVTMYGAVIAPFFDRNIYRIRWTYTTEDWEKDQSPHETTDVTDSNLSILLDCCGKAIISPYMH